MAFRSSIPNIIEPIVDTQGRINKAWWDFFLNLWQKVGGESDVIPGIDESDIRSFIDSKATIQSNQKRIKDLESLQFVDNKASVAEQKKQLKDLESNLASISRSFRQGRRPLLPRRPWRPFPHHRLSRPWCRPHRSCGSTADRCPGLPSPCCPCRYTF